MHSSANDHQSTFLEFEAELLMNNSSYEFNQTKMREAVINWVNDQVNDAGFEVTHSGSGFVVTYLDQESSYQWGNADALAYLVETIKENK